MKLIVNNKYGIFQGCVNQYDPKGDKVPVNPPNQCGPKYECNNNAQTQTTDQQSNIRSHTQ